MPVHIRSQPTPGSRQAAEEDECKARIVDIARRHRVPVIDFRIPSEITATDSNYWDPLHYRLPIADRIVSGLERALATHKDNPGGDWRYIGAVGERTASPWQSVRLRAFAASKAVLSGANDPDPRGRQISLDARMPND